MIIHYHVLMVITALNGPLGKPFTYPEPFKSEKECLDFVQEGKAFGPAQALGAQIKAIAPTDFPEFYIKAVCKPDGVDV